MATLTLKDVPDTLHQQLKERARKNRRSLNSEVIHCLEQIVVGWPTDPDAYLDRIRTLRDRATKLPLDDNRLRAAREGGRS